MRKCRNCGAPLEKGAKHCGSCGAPVRRRRWPIVVALLAAVAVAAAIVVVVLWNLGVIGGAAAPGGASGGDPGGGDGATAVAGVTDGTFVQFNAGFTDEKIDSEEAARTVAADIATSLGLAGADDLGACQTEEDDGVTFYRFGQLYEGIPVYGRSVAVGAGSDGGAAGATSNLAAIEGVDTDPAIGQDEAAEIMTRAGVWTLSGSPQLCVYSLNTAPTLAWHCDAYAADDAQRVFIDGQTGEVVASLDLRYFETISGEDATGSDVDVEVQPSGEETYRLRDEEFNIYGYDADRAEPSFEYTAGTDENGRDYSFTRQGDLIYFTGDDGTVYQDRSIEGNFFQLIDQAGETVAERARLSAITPVAEGDGGGLALATGKEDELFRGGLQQATTYYAWIQDDLAFYHDVLGRQGFDNLGSQVHVVGNATITSEGGDNSNNAYSVTPMGHATMLVVGHKLSDVDKATVMHELTHSVESSMSGMAYEGESGALMEATSDVMGSIAEDYFDNGLLDGSGDWEIAQFRNVADPSDSWGQVYPERVGDEAWGDPTDRGENDDNGHVHNNSTVVSHAFYRMCEDDALDGEALTTEQLAHLVYLSFMQAPANCTFAQYRAIVENAAAILVDEGRMTEEQAARVSAAFEAAGIGALSGFSAVSRDAALQVYDINDEPYGTYSVTGSRTSADIFGFEFDLTVQDEDAPETWSLSSKGTDPLPMEIPGYGLYRLSIEDEGADATAFTAYVLAMPFGADTYEAHTSFGRSEKMAAGAQTLPGTRDVALVLDVSSSMSGEPIDQLKEAADRFVDVAIEGEARAGVITYADDAEVVQQLSESDGLLSAQIAEIEANGNTNIDAGLTTASSMMATSTAARKIVVLMSDGEPNRGRTGDELVAYADELKQQDFLIYAVGIGSDAAGNELLSRIASEGCYYELAGAGELEGFFADIANEINGVRQTYHRIACPVDVTVTYEGETLSSAEATRNTRTSFGTITFEDELDENGNVVEEDGIKVLRLKEGPAYEIQLTGTGEGTMAYTAGFLDETGVYTDFRSFDGVEVTARTRMATTGEVSDATRLEIDYDGDGRIDRALEAGAGETAHEVDNGVFADIAVGACFGLTVLGAGGAIALRRRSRRRRQAVSD